jgi:hypothetical protein
MASLQWEHLNHLFCRNASLCEFLGILGRSSCIGGVLYVQFNGIDVITIVTQLGMT